MTTNPNCRQSGITGRATEPERPAFSSLLLSLLLAAAAPELAAVERLHLGIGEIEGPFGRIDGLQVELLPGPPVAGRLHAESLTLADGTVLDGLEVRCPDLELDGAVIRCPAIRGDASLPAIGGIRLDGEVAWDRRRRALSLDVQAHLDSDSTLQLAGEWRQQVGGEMELSLERAPVVPLLALGGLTDWSGPGGVSGDLRVRLDGAAQPRRLQGALRLDSAGLSNAEGTVATEALNLEATVALTRRDTDRWDGQLRLTSDGGQAYVDPVFLDLDSHPLRLTAAGRFQDNRLQLEQGRLEHQGLGEARITAAASLAPPALQALSLSVRGLQLDGGYRVYLQPFLIGTALDSLEADGHMDADLRFDGGGLRSVFAEIEDGALLDQRGRFRLNGLGASLAWSDTGERQPGWIRWSDAALYQIGLGAAEADLALGRDGGHLLAPLRLPVEDGALLVRSLSVGGIGLDGESVDVGLDAELDPISLNRLAAAFDWPALGGRVSGRLPGLSYRDGELLLDGALDVQVFDGELRVTGFRLRDPLGVLPQLQADVRMRNLDLSRLTRTFAIGRITGRLHGDLLGLELQNWQPTRFDARLYTPADDRSRRRISQRAIDTISSISGGGGGAQALISRGALRFFDEFRYDRMALSCVLRDEICHMDGLEPQNGGYVIIRGRGLPRIDVVGFNRSVSWPTLIDQIITVMEQQEE